MSDTTKGRMKRGGFEPRDWTVECGAHGCDMTASVPSAESLRLAGWHFDKRGGYGWICLPCQANPLPEDQS